MKPIPQALTTALATVTVFYSVLASASAEENEKEAKPEPQAKTTSPAKKPEKKPDSPVAPKLKIGGKVAAKEAATTAARAMASKEGYSVRRDSWSGEAIAGGQVAVRHQLFKGHEYVFWLGSKEVADVELGVFSRDRKPVHTSVTTIDGVACVRVNPPATGTYLVVFSLKPADDTRTPWALVYGYR